MALTSGARLGPYEIVGLLGAGGMGEVYRARDPRLGRDVAIKVLPAGLSSDPERLRRFEQEARAAAALNHPGILAVHDIGTEASAPYIVSELLEGETLRDRLNRGATSGSAGDHGLALRKAVEYAIQFAHALAAAHEKGIVHRDLKPENVFITADGRVKILDFGLAKLTEASVALSGAASLATAAVETQPGVLLGTMGYMAPEQVRGQTADHRADIFAFGTILYEMLSGQRAFRGATAADTISALLDRDPVDLPVAERHIPPALARVVDRCLEKSPAARFQSTHDLAFALEALSPPTGTAEHIGTVSHPRLEKRGWSALAVGAGILFGVTVAVAAASLLRPRTDAPLMRFSIVSRVSLGGPNTALALTVSPDGRYITFSGTSGDSTANQLWIRAIDSLEPRVMPGTASLSPGVFWSPDSRSIGFFSDNKLKRIDVAGGVPQVICDAPGPFGGTWSGDVIVFGTVSSGLFRVSAHGGQPVPITTLDKSKAEGSHRLPFFLPDGKRFVYRVQPQGTIALGSLDTRGATSLLNADSKAMYAAGSLVFVRGGTLFAQPFDATAATTSGEPVPIAQEVAVNPGTGAAQFAVSASGLLAFRTGSFLTVPPSQLTWYDRAGRGVGQVGAPDGYFGIELAPDEQRVAVHPHEQIGGGDQWVIDLTHGKKMRLTFGAHNIAAVWSPDGRMIAIGSNHPLAGAPSVEPYALPFNIFQKPSDGTGELTMLLDSTTAKLPPNWKQPTSWSPDGQLLVLDVMDPKTNFDVWAVPMTGDRTPRPLLHTEFQELQGQISPDGKWLAYASNETRRREIYVRPLSNLAGKWQISTNGGTYPKWRRDGKEIFFISADRKLMAVDVNTAGAAFESGVAHALFDVHLITPFLMPEPIPAFNLSYPYAVADNGRRFLIATEAPQQDANTPITVVVNWPATLKQ